MGSRARTSKYRRYGKWSFPPSALGRDWAMSVCCVSGEVSAERIPARAFMCLGARNGRKQQRGDDGLAQVVPEMGISGPWIFTIIEALASFGVVTCNGQAAFIPSSSFAHPIFTPPNANNVLFWATATSPSAVLILHWPLAVLYRSPSSTSPGHNVHRRASQQWSREFLHLPPCSMLPSVAVCPPKGGAFCGEAGGKGVVGSR